MRKAYIFDMISRTLGEELPECSFYAEDPQAGYNIIFRGDLDTLSAIPTRLDIAIEENILVGDAKQQGIRKNGRGYEAHYSAYALHQFEDSIPS